MASSDFKWIAANMKVTAPYYPMPQPEPYHIFAMKDFSVGVLAITQAPPATALGGIAGLEFAADYAGVARRYEYLRDEVDVLIALNHIGVWADHDLAEAVDFFDIIIGGHSHAVLETPVIVKGTPIVQAGASLNYIGHLTFKIDKGAKEVISIDGFLQSVAELEEVDPYVQALVDGYTGEMEEFLGTVIGRTNTGLIRDTGYQTDVSLGNFWTDAMRNLFDADIAVTNNGGIRHNIEPGEINAGDIYRVEPFGNQIMEIIMTGQGIKDVIDYSYQRRNRLDLQTSGLTYNIITTPAGDMIRSELFVKGEPIELDGYYSVAVPDYIGTGGSGYNLVGEIVQAEAGYITNAMIMYAGFLMEEYGAIDYYSESRINVIAEEIALFSDFTAGERGLPQIYSLVQEGVIKGFGDKTFRANDELTRAQAAIMIARAKGLDLENVADPGFNDVITSNYFYREIAAVQNAGIFIGDENGFFKGEQALTRGDMTVILSRAYGLEKECIEAEMDNAVTRRDFAILLYESR